MAQCQSSTCTMVHNVAFYAVAVLLIVVPITGLPVTTSAVQPQPPPPQQQPHGLPASFINDPFYHPTPTHPTGQNNAGSNAYHHNSGSSSPVQPPQDYNLYHYNYGAANPVPSYNNNNYQYHSSGYPNHHAAGSHHYSVTTAAPVAQPAAGGSYSQTGGQEEYEAEDGRMPSAGTAAGIGGGQGYQLSAQPPAQHNFYYGNYGAGRGSNYGTGGLLEAIRPQYQYRQQPSWFNNPLFYYALSTW